MKPASIPPGPPPPAEVYALARAIARLMAADPTPARLPPANQGR